MYTEEEAKAKWCPLITYAIPSAREIRNPGSSYDECLGSRCMAWRWIGSKGPEQQGYCGLAGKP